MLPIDSIAVLSNSVIRMTRVDPMRNALKTNEMGITNANGIDIQVIKISCRNAGSVANAAFIPSREYLVAYTMRMRPVLFSGVFLFVLIIYTEITFGGVNNWGTIG